MSQGLTISENLLFVQRTGVRSPEPTLGRPQLSVTPGLGNMPPLAFLGPHSHVQRHTYLDKNNTNLFQTFKRNSVVFLTIENVGRS